MRRFGIALAAFLAVISAPALLVALVATTGGETEPSEAALEEIPSDLLPVYRAAASTCEGLDWTVLAAIHKVETGFGTGPARSHAGAQGPMQFMPSTFAAYRVDGNADGRAAIDDPIDAIFSAANLLCANGAGDPQRLRKAVWTYNHSDTYVDDILELAASYGVWGSADLGGAINLSPDARTDVESGRVDPRLIQVLEVVAQRYELTVSIFKTGHSRYTRSGSVSNHWYGRAADISTVNGRPVSVMNADAYELVADLLTLPTGIRPTEVGHPFAILLTLGGFTDADHRDHIHLGFD